MATILKRTVADGGVRYDVRVRIDGRVVTRTFHRRRDAEAWVATTLADRLRGVAVDPRRARISVREYAEEWLRQRADLSERTTELYAWLLAKKILPALGGMQLGKLSPGTVRSWHAALAKQGPSTAAKSYRLLSEILRTAMFDEIVTRNPCQVKGAGNEKPAERQVVSVVQIAALTDAMPEHLRVVLLLAAWCQLRRAEIMGLRRRDVNLLHGMVTVEETRTRLMTGKLVVKGPKTESGRRTVTMPPHVAEELGRHLDAYVGSDSDALIVAASGRAVDLAWDKARKSVGEPGLRLHDLRHSGLTLAAATGATVAELMHRAGHSSPDAALRYQHATRDRDRVIADALGELAVSAKVTMEGQGDAGKGRVMLRRDQDEPHE